MSDQDEKPKVTEGVAGFPDTFFGPQDKKYMDRLALDMVKVRGVNFKYFKKLDTPERIDGDEPLTDNPDRDAGDPQGRLGNAALYGEPFDIGTRIDSVTREVSQAWNYTQGFDMRGVVFNPQQSDTADDRGHVGVYKLTLNLARAMCEDVSIVPQIGDVVEMPTLLSGLFDVAQVQRDQHRFGGTGFFTAYELSLVRSTKYLPQRKELPGVPI